MALVGAFWLLLRWVFFEGFQGSDDFHHLRYALSWDRLPKNQWEARLLYNWLLRAALKGFGYSEAAAALPGMLGSFMLCASGMWLAWRRWGGVRMWLVTGLLLASLPSDILQCTTPSAARVLATGFLAVATAFLLGGRGWLSACCAGSLFALGVFTHLAVIFYVPILLCATALFEAQRRKNCALAALTAGICFAAMDMGVFGWWTGDPLYRFKVITGVYFRDLPGDVNARNVLGLDGRIDWVFFTRPLKDLLVSKAYGLCAALALVGGLATWRRRSRLARVLIITTGGFWLWMSFGTHQATAYTAFPGTTAYWHPWVLIIVLIVSELFTQMRRRLAGVVAVVALMAMGTALCALSGSWGQSVEASKELLAYIRRNPQLRYVADDRTLTEICVLNAFQPLPHLWAAPNSDGAKFVLAQRMPTDPQQEEGRWLVLVNPLNDRYGEPTFRWISQHAGAEVYRGETTYRLLTYVLPQRWREAHPWTVRKPAARVCRLDRLAVWLTVGATQVRRQ